MHTTSSQDRPLSAAANISLQIGAALTILLFYFFVFISIWTLIALLGAELVLLVGLARFGMARLFAPIMEKHIKLLTCFFRSLWLGKSADFRIPLPQEDAPGLYLALEKICQKAEVPMPQKVFLEMSVNAWVHMKGYRRGKGVTILGIGYDLMSGLSQTEVEGVLAHEMMHAKLVKRGFRQLLTGGVARAAKLSYQLSSIVSEKRRLKHFGFLPETFSRGADALTRLAVRQVAACSRQDEFEADHGAAEVCGAGAIRSALLKLEGLSRIASRLSLRERVARLESGGGFGQWLVGELAAAHKTGVPEAKAEAFNKYSTHPSMHDRLVALSSFTDQSLADSPPAFEFFAYPDQVAEKLVTQIQKQAVVQEQKDSKALDRWTRKSGKFQGLRPLEAFGTLFIIVGAVCGCITWIAGGFLAGLAVFIVMVGMGFAMRRLGRYREKISLPVPDYALIRAAARKKIEVTDAQVKAVEAEMNKLAAEARKKKQKAAIFLDLSYKALEKCDYVRAHIAARLCVLQETKSVPGCLALAVAAGGLKNEDQTERAVIFIRQKTGMRGESSSWGAGWALLLIGEYARAEAYLEKARAKRPDNPTVLALLAISQVKRGKLFSAIAGARKALELVPGNKEHEKLLFDLLLQGGFLREAGEMAGRLAADAMTDSDLMMAMVKFNLLLLDDKAAGEWMEQVRQSSVGPEKFVTLGEACESARRDEKAAEFFRLALESGHYPEALLGLGRLEAHRENKEQAREHFLAALDLNRPTGVNSVGAIPLVLPVLERLRELQEPVLNCRGWVATLKGQTKSPALNGVTFLIFAPDNAAAQKELNDVLVALQPGVPPPSTSLRQAPNEQQPDGPVYPGIQAILN